MRASRSELAKGIWVVEDALPPRVLSALLAEVARLQRRVGKKQLARWNASDGGRRRSFWYPLEQRPRNAFERAIAGLQAHIGLRCAGAEWWFNIVSPDRQVPLHFDKDESLKESTGRIQAPLLASIFYLCDVGCPTVIQNLRAGMVALSRLSATPQLQVFVPPRTNRYAIFAGDHLHGAAPPVGDEARYLRRGAALRIVLAINWWDDKPMAPRCIALEDARLSRLCDAMGGAAS